MTTEEIEMVKADFLEWTGGFEPETAQDIETYIDTALPNNLDPAEALTALRSWMHETESSQIRRNIDHQ